MPEVQTLFYRNRLVKNICNDNIRRKYSLEFDTKSGKVCMSDINSMLNGSNQLMGSLKENLESMQYQIYRYI